MINEIKTSDLENTGNRGPQMEKTEMAQKAIDEFLESGLDACSVQWKEIDLDFDQAKKSLAYRINHSKKAGMEGANDLAMRSNRSLSEVYLVHTDKVE